MVTTIDNAEHYIWGHQCDGWHLLKSDSFSVIRERMPPSTSEIEHHHVLSQQVFFVLSGTATFFLNGKLEKSFNGETLSYMHLFDIIAGENDGLNGGICNVVYFNEMLNIKQVYYLYNSVKEMDPPIMLNFYNMLYLKSLKIENVTEKVGLTQIK